MKPLIAYGTRWSKIHEMPVRPASQNKNAPHSMPKADDRAGNVEEPSEGRYLMFLRPAYSFNSVDWQGKIAAVTQKVDASTTEMSEKVNASTTAMSKKVEASKDSMLQGLQEFRKEMNDKLKSLQDVQNAMNSELGACKMPNKANRRPNEIEGLQDP